MKLEDFEPVYIPNALFMQFIDENGECISVRAEHYVKFLNEILRGKTMFIAGNSANIMTKQNLSKPHFRDI